MPYFTFSYTDTIDKKYMKMIILLFYHPDSCFVHV
jgi:hypothetical protein